MNKNSQIRAHARHLLDDNILGKDWLKGVLVIFVMAITEFFIVQALISIAGVVCGVLLVAALRLDSVVLTYLITMFVYGAAIFIAYGVMGPLNVGIASVYTNLVRNGEKIRIKNFFYGFKGFFSNAILAIMYNIVVASLFPVSTLHTLMLWYSTLRETTLNTDGNSALTKVKDLWKATVGSSSSFRSAISVGSSSVWHS